MIARAKFIASSALLLGVTLANQVSAHDLFGLITESASLDAETAQKFEDIDELRGIIGARARASGGSGEGQLEAVVQQSLRWPDGKVTVCFFDGSKAARDDVAEAAALWTQGTSIAFDFGPRGSRTTCAPPSPGAAPADIRVSFNGQGQWSYVGIKARFIGPTRQTLNLQGMGGGRLSTSQKATVLHEFGHAIGFEHEHQSPTGGCEAEFNWPFLYTAFGWPKAQVDRNMKQLSRTQSRDGLFATAFDRDSIMLYALTPQAFLAGARSKCFIPQKNTLPSPTDMQAVRMLYPITEDVPMAALPEPGAADTAISSAVEELGELTQPPATTDR